MILIIEGADLVGKSTLAERVSAVEGWPIVKIRWALTRDVQAETWGMAAATNKLLLGLRPDVILDRCYFSMWAYGEEPDYMPELIARFDRVSSVLPCRLVVLTASPEELTRRYERSPDAFFSLETILRANERFHTLPELVPASLPWLSIDTSVHNTDAVAGKVFAFLAEDCERRKNRA